MPAVLDLCDGRPKSSHMAAIFRSMLLAFHRSVQPDGQAAADWLMEGFTATPRDLFTAVRARLTYTREPVCQDAAQSLQETVARQIASGAGGDCEDFTIAISACLAQSGQQPGLWVFIGDESDPWRHVVNGFLLGSELYLVDATQVDGLGWAVPPTAFISTIINPADGSRRDMFTETAPSGATTGVGGMELVAPMPVCPCTDLMLMQGSTLGVGLRWDFGQKLIDTVIKPVGKVLGPVFDVLIQAGGQIIGTIIGGPIGKAIGGAISNVWGGTVSALMQNRSSITTVVKRRMRTSVQGLAAAMLGGPTQMQGILNAIPGYQAMQPILAQPLVGRVVPAAISGDVELLLRDKDFMAQAIEQVPGVGVQTADLLRNIDNAVQAGQATISDAEKAGLLALSNIHGQLQLVDGNAVAEFKGVAMELDAIAKEIQSRASTVGVGAEATVAEMAAAAINAAVTPTQAALQRLQAALLGDTLESEAQNVVASAFDFLDGVAPISLPVRFTVEPGAMASWQNNILAIWDGSQVSPGDVVLLAPPQASFAQVKSQYGAVLVYLPQLPTMIDRAQLYDADTLVDYRGLFGEGIGPARLAWVLKQAAATGAQVSQPMEVLRPDLTPTGQFVRLDLAAMRIKPDAARLKTIPGGDLYPSRGTVSDLPRVTSVRGSDIFRNPRAGTVRADGTWHPDWISAIEVSQDREMVAAKVPLKPLNVPAQLYNGKANPTADWIAFVLAAGGEVVRFQGQWYGAAWLADRMATLQREADEYRRREQAYFDAWERAQRELAGTNLYDVNAVAPDSLWRVLVPSGHPGTFTALEIIDLLDNNLLPDAATLQSESELGDGQRVVFGTAIIERVQLWMDGYRNVPLSAVQRVIEEYKPGPPPVLNLSGAVVPSSVLNADPTKDAVSLDRPPALTGRNDAGSGSGGGAGGALALALMLLG